MLRIFCVILPYNNRNKYKLITMREKIDCFMPCCDLSDIKETLQTLRQSKTIQHINLLIDDEAKQLMLFEETKRYVLS